MPMELRDVFAALEGSRRLRRRTGRGRRIWPSTRARATRQRLLLRPRLRRRRARLGRKAVANGAVALVAERRLDLPTPQIVVADARAALATVSDEYWGRPTETLPVVGVTGTSGKTTTAYLLHSILEAAGRRPGLYSTIETQIGSERIAAPTWTPGGFHLHGAFRSMLDAGNLSCAIEATSYDSDLRRLDRVRFAALVFTNLGHDHLDHHGTLEAYFAAKRRLFLEGDPPAAINLDDP